jgi:hypothetical protein
VFVDLETGQLIRPGREGTRDPGLLRNDLSPQERDEAEDRILDALHEFGGPEHVRGRWRGGPRVYHVGTSPFVELWAHRLCTTMASDGDRPRQTHGEGTMARPKPPEGTTARITIVLPAKALERVKEMAEETATPPSVLIRKWIMGHINGAGVDRRGDEE